MATAVLGDALHLHSGGVDLAFPHHCNEIAQAEAASLPAGASACCAPGTEHAALQGKKWVQAWLHCGHVHIHGRKMSKSLKNFVTVRSMLQQLGRDGADAFRWWCAERHYRSSATWDDAAMQAALSAVQRLAAWRQRVQVVCDEAEAGQVLPGAAISAWRSGNTSPAADAHVQGISWGPHEQALLDTLHTAMAHAHASLAADFDTAHALRALQRVAAAADTYTSSVSHPNSMLLRQVIRTTQDLAEALGFTFLSATGAACAPAEPSDSPAPPNSAALVAAVREQVRALGLRQDMPPAAQQALLGLADTVRDAVLPQLPGGAAFAVDSPTQRNAADRAWQVAIAEAAASTPSGAKAASSGNSAPRGAREVPAWQRGSHWEDLSCPPSAVFADSSQYSAWDDQGVPTHDAEGAPLSKNGIKKRRKALDKYE
ncbi:cars1, partial [Symbiodinium sp. KB8]